MISSVGKISRLKGFFRSGINYSGYGKMIEVAERKASGALPKDLLSCLISNNADKRAAIVGTEKLLTDAVEILGNVNKLEIQSINRVRPKSRYFANLVNDLVEGKVRNLFNSDPLFVEKELETMLRAESRILGGIKKFIPQAENVVITPIGSGTFGNVYKLQILGKNGQQIISDKVIKVYRDQFLLTSIKDKGRRYAHTLDDEQLMLHFEDEKQVADKVGLSVPNMTVGSLRKAIESPTDFATESLNDAMTMHGAMAEANISEYLRYFSGHNVTPQEGIAIPSFFGLGKTKFSIGEFISDKTKAEKKFNFGRLLMMHRDFEFNPENSINGICIDMGGIGSLSNVVGAEAIPNKNTMRIVKSMFNSPLSKRDDIFEKFKSVVNLPQEFVNKIGFIVKHSMN